MVCGKMQSENDLHGRGWIIEGVQHRAGGANRGAGFAVAVGALPEHLNSGGDFLLELLEIGDFLFDGADLQFEARPQTAGGGRTDR